VNFSYLQGPGAFQQLIIEKIQEETKNFKTFFFRDGHGLHYEAGQFITLIDRTGLQEIRRSYSMVSSPALKEPLAIGVKRLDNGFFSRRLIDQARSGDTLLTTGVSGFFKLPENIQSFKSFFFFAAGSGITPILSLIKTILYVYPDKKVYLSYSNPSLASTAYYQDLKKTEHLHPEQLTVNFLFSNATDLRKARLNREFLLNILEVNAADREKTFFYTCGPPAYMRLVIFLLLEEGYPQEHIKREDFNPGNKKLSLRMPPEKNNCLVKMKLGGLNVDFMVQYPDTILQAAKRVKLILPYSCETGKCGTCAARCISGKVWHSNNEVLTDQDLAKGFILTCTGYAQSNDLVLEID
jgi:ring-1,2-phenylacetyl-CoA epoxidase subunit PaaE